MANSNSQGEKKELRALRALSVLEIVSRENRILNIAELETLSGLPRATVYRIVDKLVKEDYLYRQIGGRGITVGHKLLSLAQHIMGSDSVRMVRHEILTRLVERVGETCNLSVPDGSQMMYLDRVEAHWPLRLHMPVGTRVPMHCTANGKLFLAYLNEDEQREKIASLTLEKQGDNTITEPKVLVKELQKIREQGYSTDNEELFSGMIAVSVPILNARRKMIAGVAVTAPIARMSIDDALVHIPALQDAAGELSNYLERK